MWTEIHKLWFVATKNTQNVDLGEQKSTICELVRVIIHKMELKELGKGRELLRGFGD
jgi:hypothetical protein